MVDVVQGRREGPPLVLLHGNGVISVDWSWVLTAFSRTRRVYVPDLLGSGVSDKPRGVDYSPAWMTGVVSAFMDSLGVGRAALVLIPVAQAGEAAARLGDREPMIFAGYGHVPHIECPDHFAEAVLRFLDEAEV